MSNCSTVPNFPALTGLLKSERQVEQWVSMIHIRQNSKKLLLISVVITLLLVVWLLFTPKGWLEYSRITSNLEKVEEENRTLAINNQLLQQKIAKLLNDSEHIEKIARNKHNLVKKNEIIFDFTRK